MNKNQSKILTTLITLIYIVGFYYIFPKLGNTYVIFSIIPLLLWLWFYNLGLALLVQVAFILCNILFLHILKLDFEPLLSISHIAGTLLNILILAAIYALKSTINRNKEDGFILEKYKNQLNSLLANIPDVVGILDSEGIITYKSPNIKQLFGWKPDELIGKPGWEAVHPEDSFRVKRKFYDLLLKPEKSIVIKFNFRQKNGTYKKVELTAKNKINDPNIKGILINYHDISDEEKTNNAVKESEKRYRTLFENSIDVVCLLDNKGNILDVNQAGIDFYGYSRAEFAKMNIEHLRHPADVNKSETFMKELDDKGSYRMYEGRIITKTGKIKWIQVNSVAFYNDDTKIGSQDIIRDITENKKREEELKTLNATKTKLFSIISHDLRNPFTAITGFSELILDRIKNKNNDNIEEFADMILQSSVQTEKLLRNLLHWSRSQSEGFHFNPVKTNLNEILAEELILLETTALQKQIQLITQLKSDMLIVADKNMIATVIRNLISNAIKFTPKKGKVTINASKNTTEVLFSVHDTGVGILKENLTKLFSINDSMSTKGTNNEVGTGLGLVLCKDFIEMHGGKIWAESEVGKGSTFYMNLPNKT